MKQTLLSLKVSDFAGIDMDSLQTVFFCDHVCARSFAAIERLWRHCVSALASSSSFRVMQRRHRRPFCCWCNRHAACAIAVRV